MQRSSDKPRRNQESPPESARPRKEPPLAQVASFIDLFIWILVLKSFFLPLFIIPTGSMAETLTGAHANHACPNCGLDYQVNCHEEQEPEWVQCPNCRFRESRDSRRTAGNRIDVKAGDRIVVHGWPYDFGGVLGPRRWDVVVFRNPNDPQMNYIKRLVGLPGETLDIIDGDLYVNGHIADKPLPAQGSLWFRYYDQDYLPLRAAGTDGDYLPHWAALQPDAGWKDLRSREIRFDGKDAPRAEIQFGTSQQNPLEPGVVSDIYGYNGGDGGNIVSDARLSATVALQDGDGSVELSITKYGHCFFATLAADGTLRLEHATATDPLRRIWAEKVISPVGPIALAISHLDYEVRVELDGRPVLRTRQDQYAVSPEQARRNAQRPESPLLRIAAERIEAVLTHVLIERDVYYTRPSSPPGYRPRQLNVPITLGPRDYFVMGDNSPQSFDSRLWETPGMHLRAAFSRGDYHLGTVPADQMIGRAFLVYWPGFLPLFPGGPNVLPDFGRIRWIH